MLHCGVWRILQTCGYIVSDNIRKIEYKPTLVKTMGRLAIVQVVRPGSWRLAKSPPRQVFLAKL